MVSATKLHKRSTEILEAAQKVFAAKGFHDATVAEVAREAGVSEKTVYEYFPSKEELLFQIPVAPTLEGIAELERVLPHVRGAANKLRSIIYHFVSFYAEHRDYSAVILMSLRRHPNFPRTATFERLRTTYQVIDDVVHDGVASGEFARGTDPLLVRWAVIGTLEYIVHRWLQQGEPADPVALVDPLADLIVRGISRSTPAGEWTLRLRLEAAGGDGGVVVTPVEEVPAAPDNGAPAHPQRTKRPSGSRRSGSGTAGGRGTRRT